MKFGFIAKHRGIWPAEWLCEALGVSRGGFYAWLTRPRSQRSRSDEALGAKVRASFLASDRTYGARRIWHDMLAEGISCGLHRIERLMRLQALKARPRRRRLPPIWGNGSTPPSLPTCSTAASKCLLPPQMDCRLHLYLDGGRLALCGGRCRSLLAACRRLVDERGDDGPVRHRCSGDGDLAPRQARRADPSLRSRTVHQ